MNPKFAIAWLVLVSITVIGFGQEAGLFQPVEVQNFSIGMGTPLASLDPARIEYLGLVDEQVLEIQAIRKKFEQLADKIKNSNSLAYEEQKAKLSELAGRLNAELKGVLLPEQKELLNGLGTYVEIQHSSLVYSLIDGLIAQQIGLTNSERRAVKQAAREAFKEYKNEIERSHHKAIDRLIDSFPVDKQDGLKDLLEPMLFKGDGGLFAENTDYHFNTDNLYPEESDPKESPRADDK